MTLPGIAGFILTIGMGVDSNVLIFERIREELATKKGARQAIAAGFDRVFSTIVDTHVVVAHRRGVPVPVRHRADPRLRDDAVLRSALQRLHRRLRVAHAVRVHPLAKAGRRDAAEHLAWSDSRHAHLRRTRTSTSSSGGGTPSSLSLVVIGAGIATIVARGGLPLGVDFTGGTVVVARVRAAGRARTPCGTALGPLGGRRRRAAVRRPAAERQIMIRLPLTPGAEQGDEPRARTPSASRQALRAANIGDFKVDQPRRSSARRSAQDLQAQGHLGHGLPRSAASSSTSRSGSGSASPSAPSSRRSTTSS